MKQEGRKLTYAHRFFYEKHVAPIPKGLVIDHLCRNRRCVNPAHLEPVLPHINSRRGAKTRLTEAAVVAIRAAIEGGAHTEEVANAYRICASHVASICAGTRWAAVGGPILKSMKRKGRRKAKISTPDIAQIRAMRQAGMKNIDIARQFGISQAYASQLATGALERPRGANV